ncbi:hypothetical protein BH09PSE6_BH09PSE6_10290 [soil metagenome]
MTREARANHQFGLQRRQRRQWRIALDHRDDAVCRANADLGRRHMHRGERRLGERGLLDIVEAGHRQIGRHCKTVLAGLIDRADGLQVGGADQRRRPLAALQQLAQRDAAAVETERLLDQPLGPERQSGRLERRARAGGARPHAFVACRQAVAQRDAGVAMIEDQARHPGRRVVVGEADAMRISRLVDRPGQHARQAMPANQLVHFGRMVVADQHDGVDAALDDGARDLDLAIAPVFVAGHQQLVTVRPQGLLQRMDRAGEDRIAERRIDGGHRAGAPRCQRLGGAVAHVAELHHRLPHLLERRRLDLGRHRQRT